MKHTITDRSDAYFTLLKHLQFLSGRHESGNSPIDSASQKTFARWLGALGVDRSRAANKARETLVSITLEVIDSAALSVENLLQLRNDKTMFAAELRQNYSQRVESYVEQLSVPGLTDTDAKGLTEDFRRSMEMDLHRLHDELKIAAGRVLLSKELAVAIAAPIVGSTILTATGIGTVLGGAFGIAALGKLNFEYRSARNRVFQEHPMAFLYASRGARLY